MAGKMVWALVAGFLSGVFVATLWPLGTALLYFVLLLAALAASFAFVQRERRTALVLITLCLASFASGAWRLQVSEPQHDAKLSSLLGEQVTLQGFVSAEPDIRERSERITIDVDTLLLGATTTGVSARILAVMPLHSGVQYGDVVEVRGILERPERFGDEGREFDYPGFLEKDGILYMLSFAQASTTGEWRGNLVQSAALSVKHVFLRGVRTALPEPQAGLAGGITVGDKRSLGADLTQSFRDASLVHIVVLSGYNITIVISGLLFMLGFAASFVKFGVAGIVALFFVLITGGAASAVRAAAMALIAIFARLTARVYLAGRILGVVACVMVAWNPRILVYDPGFQLSILATLGLVLFSPLFYERLPWMTKRIGLREIAASTLGTQLMVLPLLLLQSGSLSIVALPANLLALIAVPYAMGASAIAAVAGVLFGPYALPLATPAYLLLTYIIKVAEIFAAIPGAGVSVPAFGPLWLIPAYTAIFLAYRYLKKRTAPPEGGAVDP